MVLSSKCMFEMDTGISVGIFLTVLLFDVQTSLGNITSFHAYYVPQIQALWVSTFFLQEKFCKIYHITKLRRKFLLEIGTLVEFRAN